MEAYLCHYSEIGLKKGNRTYFERILEQNMRRSLQVFLPEAAFKIQKTNKRFIVEFKDEANPERVEQALSYVFGIVNYARVRVVPPEIEAIARAAVELVTQKEGQTFAIVTRRADKHFPMNSQEVNREVGAQVVAATGKGVNLSQPDITCHIEIMPRKVLVYVDKRPGPGGLPVSSSGKVLVLLSGGFDSAVASYFALKRGAKCTFIHFHSYPYTTRASQDKVIELARQLNYYQFQSKLYMVPFAETQEDIVFNTPERYRVILYRRFMMRIAERLANREGLKAIVTGESLGQVASQTLENLGAIEQVTTLPVLRPLIGLDKNEIIAVARRIGTYDISVKPHDDACTRFMPKHPETRAKLDRVLEAEKALDVEAMIEKAMEKTEVIEI
jgi:thiamine biosynthesis protein ThiI